jgi:DNA-3-methyladenine glycosylase
VRPPRRPLPREFFARDTREVARELLGCTLWARAGDGEPCAGRIVEVEAYLGADAPASHAAHGPTPRSAIMFGPPGIAYVYLSYGVHHCLNAVTGRRGEAGAVLVRAVEPLVGELAMHARRGTTERRLLAAGPGRLCQALAIDRRYDGLPLAGTGADRRKPGAPGCVWITRGRAPERIVASPRIGIRLAADRPYRYCDADSRCLSRSPGSGTL